MESYCDDTLKHNPELENSGKTKQILKHPNSDDDFLSPNFPEKISNKDVFEAITATAHDAIIVIDNNGRISYWNNSAERMFGYSAEEAIGKECHLLIAPKRFYSSYKRAFNRFKLTGGGPVIGKTLELWALKKNGVEFPVELSVSSVKIDGEWSAVGILRDISSRKRIEDALKESEGKFEALFGVSDDFIYILSKDLKVISINEYALRAFGMKQDEILGKSIYNLFPKELAVRYARNVKNIFRSGESTVIEGDLVIGDEKKLIRTSLNPIKNSKGEIIAVMGISRDLTLRVKAEEQLREYKIQLEKMVDERTAELIEINERLNKEIEEREELERSLIKLNEVLSLINKNLRHDILNDLTVINGSIEVYQETKDETILKNITHAVDRSVELIKRMRELESLVVAGGSLEPIEVAELIRNTMKNYQIEYELSGDAVVLADKAFESVIDNLVRNSIVHGKADRIKISVWNEGNYCYIRFADNGVGIPKLGDSTVEAIFEEGFSLGDTGGTGLGLYIVKKTLERYGGTIKVEENTPNGAVFLMKLELAKTGDEETETIAEETEMNVDIDLTGLKCPQPILKLNSTIKNLKKGTIVNIVADCSTFERDLKIWASVSGSTILECFYNGKIWNARVRVNHD